MILTGLPPQNELEILGQQMRAHAIADPCIIAEDCFDPRFYRRLGEDYSVSVTIEFFAMSKKAVPPPRWHGSVCILHEIGSGNEFGMPEQAILATFQWAEEQKKIAREILGYLLGPVIYEEKQVVQDVLDRMSLHWFTTAKAKSVGLDPRARDNWVQNVIEMERDRRG
jgi:hypothetical protein